MAAEDVGARDEQDRLPLSGSKKPGPPGLNDESRRPWRRLHATTWLVWLALGASLLCLQLFGREVEGDRWFRRPPGVVGVGMLWEHGWPVGFAARGQGRREEFGWEASPRLPGAGGFRYFRKEKFAVDVLVGLTLMAGAGAVVERWRRRGIIAGRFVLSSLLVVVSWAGCFWAIQRQQDASWETSVVGVALVMANLAIAATWLAFFHLCGAVLRRLSS